MNAVAPCLTATQALLDGFSPEERKSLASATQPIGRMIEPAEIANGVLWATSDRSSGVTGLVIPVDGGWAAT